MIGRWFIENWGNCLVGAILLLIAAFSIRSLIKSKKAGKCSGCPYADSCSASKLGDSTCHPSPKNQNIAGAGVDADKLQKNIAAYGFDKINMEKISLEELEKLEELLKEQNLLK